MTATTVLAAVVFLLAALLAYLLGRRSRNDLLTHEVAGLRENFRQHLHSLHIENGRRWNEVQHLKAAVERLRAGERLAARHLRARDEEVAEALHGLLTQIQELKANKAPCQV